MAGAFSGYVRQHPREADYVLQAQYAINRDQSGNTKVGAVRFVVCDRGGHLIIVDSQDDHQADFQALRPQSSADCDELVVKRLEHYCR